MVGTGSRTMADLIGLAAARHGGKPALKHKLAGEWVEVSYRQLDRTVREVALGLVALGIEPGDRVSILSHTRPEWTYACFATFAAGASVVSIYQTNSAEECHYVLHHSGARAVFVEDAEQLAKVRAVEADLPALEFVIVIEPADAGGSTISLDALRGRGQGRAQAELEKRVGSVTLDAECLLLYTSGTTGPPKACQLTHGNYRAITSAVETQDMVREDDTVYLFLPLAHALALVVQFLVLDVGATIAYWEKDPQKIVANLMELKPTFFPSVPRIFEKIHTLATSAGDPRELEQATRLGVAVREAQLRGEEVPAERQAAFERAEQALYVNVRNLFGGRLRQAVTGAAPIAPSILEFFYACGVPVMEGYGMTETASVTSVNTPEAFRFGSVGRPLPGVEVRIAADDGILIKGPNIFKGYYRDAEATREIVVDGWLQTGDLGRLDEDGFLFITGREKDIIITAGGKNISPANLEYALRHNRWISQAVVLGDGRPYLVALITLDAEETPAFAREHNLKTDEVHRSESMRAEIQTAIDEVNSHYAPVEQIKRFEILPEDLSQLTDELTPTMKLKRGIVQQKHAGTIDAIYRSPNSQGAAQPDESVSTASVKQRTVQHKSNGRAALDEAAVAESGSATRESRGRIEGLIAKRVAAATEHALEGPNQKLMRAQKPVWDALCKYYFRLETSGWERLPEETSLLIGNHSGGSLTIDAWTFVYAWWRRFGTERVLHGTAHDVLMAAPGLGDYFRQVGVIPASRQGVSTALGSGCDVVIWPGGDVDAMRNWRRRDEAVLGGRKGFVRQAIRSGVPIVPVASVGGHDTAFVLSEGRWIANGLDRVSGLKKKLRGTRLPIVLGIPFGLTIETIPTHLPLPAKIRTELLDPIHLDTDPERVNDRAYVDSIYLEVESAIQDAMDRLANQRRFPIFG
jgi:long-chain acyl-CoA synthetase